MAKENKDSSEVDVIPSQTRVYAHPDGPTNPAYNLIKGRKSKLHMKMLDKFRLLDPEGKVVESEESQDDGETETTTPPGLENQDDKSQVETPEDQEGEDEEKEDEDDDEEEIPKKKSKFLFKKGKKGK